MVTRRISPACEHCDGDCCKALNLIAKPGLHMRELLAVHYGYLPEDIDVVQIGIKHRCPNLTSRGLCALYHDDPEKDARPDYCKEYLCDKALHPKTLILEVDG